MMGFWWSIAKKMTKQNQVDEYDNPEDEMTTYLINGCPAVHKSGLHGCSAVV